MTLIFKCQNHISNFAKSPERGIAPIISQRKLHERFINERVWNNSPINTKWKTDLSIERRANSKFKIPIQNMFIVQCTASIQNTISSTVKDGFYNNIWKYDIHDKNWVEEILFHFSSNAKQGNQQEGDLLTQEQLSPAFRSGQCRPFSASRTMIR